MTQDQIEDMRECAKHHGMPVLLTVIDDIIELIKQGCLSVPLDKDPEKAALVLYAKRMELDGAVYLKNAFIQKVKDLRSAK